MNQDRMEAMVREQASRMASSEAAVQAIGQLLKKEEMAGVETDLLNGYAGMCVLFAEADQRWPEEGWDRAGHEWLVRVQQAMMRGGVGSLSLANGLAGIGMAVRALSRGGERYQKMADSINRGLWAHLPGKLAEAVQNLQTGVKIADYDAVIGLTGIGRYLLFFVEQEAMRHALCEVLEYLVLLSGESEGDNQVIPRWFLPTPMEDDHSGYTALGYVECGLAHGIPGPLALMALALREGVEVPGQREAMLRIGEWLMRWKQEGETGCFWPSVIAKQELEAGRLKRPSDRGAWCHGTPGVARALWMAGDVLGVEEWKRTAVASYLGVFSRLDQLDIHTPQFCHGLAGLLRMTQRMAVESGEESLFVHGRELAERLVAMYEEGAPWGYEKLDAPWLQMGTAGVSLTLLGWIDEEKSDWDAVFLIA